MKNFMLFVYPIEYPRGGMQDFAGDFKTEKQAHKAASEMINAALVPTEVVYHIFHRTTGRVISCRLFGRTDTRKIPLTQWKKNNNSFFKPTPPKIKRHGI